jgi:glutathione peroxidase
MKSLFLSLLLSLSLIPASAGESLMEIPFKDIDGKEQSLKAAEAKVILLVNVASECGYTKQYKGLEALWQAYKEKGLIVIGVPCNDFGSQEPGSAAEIKEFCSSKYNVTFPLTEKLVIKGANQHPLFTALTGKDSPLPGDVAWNFSKFLISKDGKLLQRFDSDVEPESDEMKAAIDKALTGE